MTSRLFARVTALIVLAIVGSAPTAAAQGIKFGPTFATFSSEALDFKNRTGIHAGLFFGGNRDGVLGVQTEVNWLRKRVGDPDIRIDYLQVPVLLRVNGGSSSSSGFVGYGIVGPAIELKIADEIEGVTLDDGFEGADVSLVFGGGIEVARIIIEGRYEKGLRRINDNFRDFTEIKKQAFTILFGVRFK
ncbi:MAG TPA: outer membrane beta-barrel protein [Vicinamibacterales bacterium]|nr:outer membrane beta-barrel protein [Vicinamibacterales bacterium]